MAEKKNIFTRIKEGWQELDKETKTWIKAIGIWTFDGYLFGRLVSEYKQKKAVNNMKEAALGVGYMTGLKDAYRDMAMNPYHQMDNSMKRLEQQGKVTKF